MLKINLFSKVYEKNDKKTEVIKGLSVFIKRGEFVVFLGPNGCGKTTLLKCISGLVKPTKGEIILDDKPVVRPERKIGMVFQDYSLFPWLTVRDNLTFGLRFNGVSINKSDKIIRYYLKIAGLYEFRNKYPKDLSGGMKQKLAIVRTLAINPELILMDEPFSSLDKITREKMQEFLVDLWKKEKRTIIFVTHDIEEALFLADKIYILSKRPTRIIKSFNVKFKRPRSKSIKNTKKFFGIKKILSSFLE